MAYKIQITQHAMKVCQRGKEMLHDLKRSEWLPVYDEEGVRVVSQVIRAAYAPGVYAHRFALNRR
jgi:hypothetical protein